MDAILSIIPDIKSWFPLVAFLIAGIVFIIRQSIKKEASLIELASEEKRAAILDRHFKGHSINLESLTPEQQYE